MRLKAVAAAVLLAAASATMLAQAPSTGPEGNHPDWIGAYKLARGEDLKGYHPEHPDDAALDEEIDKHLQPWARVKMNQTYGVADDTGAICQLDGTFRILLRGGGFGWLPAGPNRVLLLSLHIYTAGVRKVYLDRPHPKYPTPTWLGHSIGRWDGDTFVVDTVGYNDKSWLTSSMQPHTEELHSVERYRMVAPGMMELRTTIEDRQALTSPYTYTRYYKRIASEVGENVCNPEPGDQRMWTEYRVKALKFGMLPLTPK